MRDDHLVRRLRSLADECEARAEMQRRQRANRAKRAAEEETTEKMPAPSWLQQAR